MNVKTDKQFEETMAELCRFYRAQRDIYSRTHAADQREVANWVIMGGKLIEKMNVLMADIEDYSGCVDLRLVLNDFKDIRSKKEGADSRA